MANNKKIKFGRIYRRIYDLGTMNSYVIPIRCISYDPYEAGENNTCVIYEDVSTNTEYELNAKVFLNDFALT